MRLGLPAREHPAAAALMGLDLLGIPAQPVFGIAPQMLASAQPRFRSNADTIRDALTQRLGRTPRFSLVASEEVDLQAPVDSWNSW